MNPDDCLHQKTQEQKIREFNALVEIEKIRAKDRQADNARANNPNIKNVENFPQGGNGKARDKAAEKLGMSGSTAERGSRLFITFDKQHDKQNQHVKWNIQSQPIPKFAFSPYQIDI